MLLRSWLSEAGKQLLRDLDWSQVMSEWPVAARLGVLVRSLCI